MTDTEQIKTDKKVYSKPLVTEVQLVAGEAVLGDCKGAVGNLALCQSQGNLSCTSSSAAS